MTSFLAGPIFSIESKDRVPPFSGLESGGNDNLPFILSQVMHSSSNNSFMLHSSNKNNSSSSLSDMLYSCVKVEIILSKDVF